MNTAVVLAAAEGIVASKDRLVVVNSIFLVILQDLLLLAKTQYFRIA